MQFDCQQIKTMTKSDNLDITDESKEHGIISGKAVANDTTCFMYLTVNAETVDEKYLKQEAQTFWILYKYKCNPEENEPAVNNETIEKIIS